MNNQKAHVSWRKILKFVLSVIFILTSSLTIYLYLNPIQEPTGQYEWVEACPICPAFSIVEVKKPNYIFASTLEALAIGTLAGLSFLVYRDKIRNKVK